MTGAQDHSNPIKGKTERGDTGRAAWPNWERRPTAHEDRAAADPPAPIVDVDIHPALDDEHVAARLPKAWRVRYESGNRGAGKMGYWNPTGLRRRDAVTPDGVDVSASPEVLERNFLAPNGIDWGLLNLDEVTFALSPEPDYAAAIATAVNDVLREEWLPGSQRLRASIVVSPRDPIAAAKEIRRCADHSGFVQVLMPSAAAFPYGNRMYDPIYDAANEVALPVATHPGLEGAGISAPGTGVGPAGSYLEFHTGLPQSAIAHMLSLVCEGTFVKFPRLRFVLLESGFTWLPSVLWRFDKNWKGLRRTVPWLDELPSTVAARHILLGTQPVDEPPQAAHLHEILGMFPSSTMIMFSTDFPHWDGDLPDFAGRAFPKDLRPSILGGTASQLYRLHSETST